MFHLRKEELERQSGEVAVEKAQRAWGVMMENVMIPHIHYGAFLNLRLAVRGMGLINAIVQYHIDGRYGSPRARVGHS